MKYVLFYEAASDVLATAPRHMEAHRARWQAFRSSGALLMLGPFSDPREGSMAVFTTLESAREFAEGDPFVLNGVVTKWYVREWNEALA